MDLTQQDERMITLLRGDGRISVSNIARQMNVSRTAAQMRLQKLEKNGVIDGYTVNLSDNYLKNRVQAVVMLKFPPARRASIEKALENMADVRSLYSISGAFDLVAIISSAAMATLDKAIDAIGLLEGVDETMSSIILSTKIDR